MTNFDRQYRFAAGEAGGKAFEIGEPSGSIPMPLRIQFDVEKTDLETPNTGKISIWNLSQEHIAELEKTNCTAMLNAGYGSRRPLVISGLVQNNIKAQQSTGYKRWATIENLKRFAETSNFLTEHGITSYEELAEKCEAATAASDRIKADLRDINAQMDELTLKMKYAATYRQLRPVYDRYKSSRDKEKFLRGNESDIILFEAAARELKRLGAVPLPTTERMKAEMDALAARKAALKAEQQQAQREQRQYAAIRKNVDEFLSAPTPEQQRQRKQELE